MTDQPPTARPSTVAVVPLRDGASGKSRLAQVLDPGSRSRLVGVLARHVVTTLLEVAEVDHVRVVTADLEFTRSVLDGVPRAERLRVVAQRPDRPGLNPGLEAAREDLLGETLPPSRLLVAHADLPALTAADVRALLAEPADLVLATDRAAVGTNALLIDPATPFRFRFGEGSRQAHVGEAARHGMTVGVVERPGTAVDLDTVDDWQHLPAQVRYAVGEVVPALR